MGFEELRELLRSLLADLADADATERAKRTSEEFAAHQEFASELSRMRKEAIEELAARGWTHQEIAKEIGVARARVGQLLAAGPSPERALLGVGSLTVAVGGKPEAQPQTDTADPMISKPMSQAYEVIADTARECGLNSMQEIVHPPGIVDMNRPNLIVIGSPRILPVISQALAADDNLGFRCCAKGWYLVEGDKIYRSPIDRGVPTDYAYIGRLPRPDTKGTFLYLAGIHSMGTLGAAKFLTENLTELYRAVGTRRWSALIECQYNPDNRTVIATRRITPIYN